MQVLRVLVCVVLIPLTDSRGNPPDFSTSKWPKGIEYVKTPDPKVIHCNAEANPPAQYRLTFNGTSITWGANKLTFSARNGTLTTGKSFNDENNGEYQCTASNKYGTLLSPTVKLMTAVHGPFLGKIQTTTMEVFDSKYIKLDCEGIEENVPDPLVKWFRGISRDPGDFELIDYGDRMVVDNDGSLHILWTEMSDSYSYTCGTYNSVLFSTKRNPRIIKLIVKQGSQDDRGPQLVYKHNLTVHVGQNAKLMCIFTYFSKRGHKLTINWLHRGVKVYTGQSFTLKHVKLPSDAQDQEGEYLCEAVLGTTIQTGRVNLKIVGPPVFLDNGAPVRKIVPVEKDVVINCKTRSHNSYSYPPVWFKDGEPITGCPKYFFDCTRRNPADHTHCITEDKVCGNDGNDCADGSDEQFCKFTGGLCLESQKLCGQSCIPETADCPEETCNYPKFKCQLSSECIAKAKVCDGRQDCRDGSDELECPGGSVTKVGRFLLNSARTQLTVPSVGLQDSMCFQCMVRNEYGSVYGDACVTVIDKILVLKQPNSTYYVVPGSRLEILVDATTDRDWLNQMDYVWQWFKEVTDENTGTVSRVRVSLPASGKTKDYIHIPHKGRNMTIVFPEGKDDETEEAVYSELIDREYSLVIKHPFDSVEFNFTINGKAIIKPEPVVETASTNLWFIAIILGIILLFVIVALIVCIMYRNRGGKYLVDEKERKAGHDPIQELKDEGLHDVGRVEDVEDPEKAEKVSLTESVKPYESDDDPTDEYGGDFDVSKFNEEGSFIGAYGESRGREATV